MDEQGHGTANWETLEDRALGMILDIVELRDGGKMPGPPILALRDIVGKKLRVRYETAETRDSLRNFGEQGTLILTISSVQVRERGIVFGMHPHPFFLETHGRMISVQSLLFDCMERGSITASRFTIALFSRGVDGPPADSREYGLSPTNVHVLWWADAHRESRGVQPAEHVIVIRVTISCRYHEPRKERSNCIGPLFSFPTISAYAGGVWTPNGPRNTSAKHTSASSENGGIRLFPPHRSSRRTTPRSSSRPQGCTRSCRI